MSHEIKTYDEQHGREMAWHDLTKVNPLLSLDAPDFYLRSWDVRAVNIAATDDNGAVIPLGDEKWQALMVQDAKLESPLFVSTPFDSSYVPLSNGMFLDTIGQALQKAGLSFDVESTGSVFNRRRVFVSIKLPGGETFKVGRRQFKAYLNFLNSFDGSVPFLANTSNVCTVCNNTFMMNIRAGGCFVKHTRNMLAKLENLPEVVAESLKSQKEFSGDMLAFSKEAISSDHAKSLIAAFLASDGRNFAPERLGEMPLSTRTFNQTERIHSLFQTGAGNEGKDMADLLSGFTDYYSHESAGQNRLKQFASSEFGDGARSKAQSRKYLLGLGTTKKAMRDTLAVGNRLLHEYAKAE